MIYGRSIAIVFCLIASITLGNLAVPNADPNPDPTPVIDLGTKSMNLISKIIQKENEGAKDFYTCREWEQMHDEYYRVNGYRLKKNSKYSEKCVSLFHENAIKTHDQLIKGMEGREYHISQTAAMMTLLADYDQMVQDFPNLERIDETQRLYKPIRMVIDSVMRYKNLIPRDECLAQLKEHETNSELCTQQPKHADQNDHEESTHEDELEEEPVREPQVTSQETRDLLKDLQANVAQILLKNQLDESDEALLKYYYDEGTRLIRDFWHEEPTDSGLLVIMGTLNAALHQLNMPAASEDPDE